MTFPQKEGKYEERGTVAKKDNDLSFSARLKRIEEDSKVFESDENFKTIALINDENRNQGESLYSPYVFPNSFHNRLCSFESFFGTLSFTVNKISPF